MKVFSFHARGILLATAVVGCALTFGCESQRKPSADSPKPDSSGPAAATPSPVIPRLTIKGNAFYASEAVFQWRGISAFRLLEQIAHGQATEAEAFLKWAADEKLTIVRVLAMAHHLFKLTPDEGRAALPRLLEMAASRGLYVEIVALADTDSVQVDPDAHVKALGDIASRYPNALVEIANEPGHPTQREDLRDPARLQKLAALLPEPTPVALGSIEYGDGFAAADYVTTHVGRDPGDDGWGHVRAVASGATLLERWKKPVVSDEPIGAAAQYVPGRRDNNPARFRAAALLTRLTGMGATFHHEGGLQGRIPAGAELECFKAWNEAWSLLPPHVEHAGDFSVVPAGSRGEYRRLEDASGWILRLPPVFDSTLPGRHWHVAETRDLGEVRLIRVAR